MRKHHVLAFESFSKLVGKLTVLVSTEMESDRAWKPDWGELDVIVQKNSTLTLKQSSNFDEKNFIHIPWDTVSQLRRLKPDCILSYEMGARTLFSSIYRKVCRNVPIVMVGNMSNYIEQRRGKLRSGVRNIIRNAVDIATYNGPGCKTYLQSIGFDDSRLVFFPYCFDPEKTFGGKKEFSPDGIKRILFCGALSERKAVLPFAAALRRYCDSHPGRELIFDLAGDGPLKQKVADMASDNLRINVLGNCSNEELSKCYETADVCAFPSLGDEWGVGAYGSLGFRCSCARQ